MQALSPAEFIALKQSGRAHNSDDLREFIQGFVSGDIPDYQMTAWLMAVYYEGMTDEETAVLTEAMIDSGRRVRFDANMPLGDKHSTGGVGDKITLLLAPLVAATGVGVPTITGRGLGHTGGTLDKLEAIPGFRTDLTLDALAEQVGRTGLAFGAQTGDIVPADRRMYALRDVTSTVRSLPLITSSILSKKVAEGIDAIVFDVKTGSGAFMETEEKALELARWLTRMANRFGLKSAALVTSMDHPLGDTVGNWLESEECLKSLRGEGTPEDIRELTLALGGTLLALLGRAETPASAESSLLEVWESGAGFDCFRKTALDQGADESALQPDASPYEHTCETEVLAERAGRVKAIESLEVGLAAVALGAGRRSAEDDIDPAAGFRVHVKAGQEIESGERLVTVYGPDSDRCARAASRIQSAVQYLEDGEAIPPLIRKAVTSAGMWDWQEFKKRSFSDN